MTDILQEASELINGDRAQDYGDVTENFQRIAQLWSAYKDEFFYPHDVSMMMILVKVARQSEGYHRDSAVDIAGYAALDEKVHIPFEWKIFDDADATPVSQEFWDDIDKGIVEAQEKREQETTSKPPRVWESLCEVPHSVVVKDRRGDHWDFYINNWGFGTPGEIRRHPVDMEAWGVQAWDFRGPFTEVLS